MKNKTRKGNFHSGYSLRLQTRTKRMIIYLMTKHPQRRLTGDSDWPTIRRFSYYYYFIPLFIYLYTDIFFLQWRGIKENVPSRSQDTINSQDRKIGPGYGLSHFSLMVFDHKKIGTEITYSITCTDVGSCDLDIIPLCLHSFIQLPINCDLIPRFRFYTVCSSTFIHFIVSHSVDRYI